MATTKVDRRPMARRAVARDVTINVRAKSAQRELIDRAAGLLGKNRSEFILEVACREADNILLDRRLFFLDGEAHGRFMAALDASPADNARLRRLLMTRAPWE